MKTALVIMAAGIGSRFGGGIKQLTAMGPSGELIIDYSIHDALEAGFNKVVFIIRKDLEADFKALIGDRIAKITEVAYAYQEMDDLPDGYEVPEGRKKPWGTGQALLCAAGAVDEPFAVINADDYYGKEGYRLIHEWLVTTAQTKDCESMAMAGFIIGNTLSENGGVTRGLCRVDDAGNLVGIDETSNIIKTPDGAGIQKEDGVVPVDPDNLVSMNMWGFFPSFFERLKAGFPKFLDGAAANPLKAEYLLPAVVDQLLKGGEGTVAVLKTADRWFGVTYAEDKASVQQAFADLIEKGIYKSPLFG